MIFFTLTNFLLAEFFASFLGDFIKSNFEEDFGGFCGIFLNLLATIFGFLPNLVAVFFTDEVITFFLQQLF
jgi:hypothetical protein